jgi:formylmethanofuran dehydrogenase subunit E
MTAQEVFDSEDFKRCKVFHGHVCPGLSIGYKAARVAMNRLQQSRAEDEELVAIVETDSCSADAIQVLTGCTFGKGNFIFKDHGKMVLTLLSRATGEGVRVAMKPGIFKPDEEYMSLIQKVMLGDAEEEESKRLRELHFKRSCQLLGTPDDILFNITYAMKELPAKARIEASKPCAQCGEPTMPGKMVRKDGQRVCLACSEPESGFSHAHRSGLTS